MADPIPPKVNDARMIKGKPDLFGDAFRFGNRPRHAAFGNAEPDAHHGFFKQFPIFGLLDGVHLGADQFDVVFRQTSPFVKGDRQVQRCLAAQGGQNHLGFFFLDNPFHHRRNQRFHVGGVGKLGIGHNRGRVGVDEHHPVALFFQGFHRLGAGIVELTGLTNHDGARPDDQNGFDVCSFRHLISPKVRHRDTVSIR
jgi:hypothetical protein